MPLGAGPEPEIWNLLVVFDLLVRQSRAGAISCCCIVAVLLLCCCCIVAVLLLYCRCIVVANPGWRCYYVWCVFSCSEGEVWSLLSSRTRKMLQSDCVALIYATIYRLDFCCSSNKKKTRSSFFWAGTSVSFLYLLVEYLACKSKGALQNAHVKQWQVGVLLL